MYIKFMDWCALQCAWVSVVTVGAGLIGGGALCWVANGNQVSNGAIDVET
jgi:hypothetical protein